MVDPASDIYAGGLVETWAGPDIARGTVTIVAAGGGANAVTRTYLHATSMTSSKTMNGGLPISSVEDPASFGYTDSTKTTDAPKHTNPNSASLEINVAPLVAGPGPTIQVRTGNGPVTDLTLMNSVHGSITATANAGVPVDGDTWHSADAFAGVESKGAATYVATAPLGNFPTFTEVGLNLVTVGGGLGSARWRLPGPSKTPTFSRSRT